LCSEAERGDRGRSANRQTSPAFARRSNPWGKLLDEEGHTQIALDSASRLKGVISALLPSRPAASSRSASL
jgi:hypothetical protein